MMRSLLILLFFPLSVAAQINVEFEKVIHDFGEIFENGGEVSTQFKVTNKGDKKVSFINIEPSCGCTAVLTEDPEVLPGDFSFINLTYDPKGRPGSFFKSVKVDLYNGSDKETVYIGVRGKVVKEINHSENEKPKLIALELPPFQAPFRSEYDTAFFEFSSFNRWVNGITYEMDKTGYLYLNIALHLSPTEENYFYILQQTKERVKREIKKRGYPERLVLFKDTVVLNQNLETWKMGQVHLSSVQFNNDSISQPVIQREDPQKTHKNNLRDAFYYVGSTPQKLKRELKNHILNLTTQVNRKIRETGASELAITFTYPLPWGRKKAEKHFEKKSKKFLKKFNKYINFSDSLMISSAFYDFKGDSVGVYFTWNPKKKNNKPSYFIEFERNELPSILPPTYFKYMPEEAFALDTSDRDFKRMMSNVMKTLPQSSGQLKFFIQSTADARPNRNYSDRSYLALKRGGVIEEQFKKYLSEHIPDSIPYQITTIPWVKGYEKESPFIEQPPERNNYITIVPVMNVDSTKKLLPYKINFDQAFLTIDNSSPFFNAFLDGLVEIINDQGSVQVIVESSSSKVPIKRGPGPLVCSIIRSESMLEKLRDGLRHRGISPNRLLVKEVNHVVSGPVYEGEYVKNKFFPHQYVKVIPVHK